MEKKPFSIIAFAASMAMLLLVTMFGATASALEPQAVTLALNPAEQVVAVGETFTVEVDATGLENIGGFEFTLSYDATKVSFNEASLNTTFLTGRTFIATGPNDDNGSVTYGAFSLGTDPGPTGDGMLATFTFTVDAEGESNIEFTSSQVTDISGGAQEIESSTGAIVNPSDPTAIQLTQISSQGETLPWAMILGSLIVSGLVVVVVRRISAVKS